MLVGLTGFGLGEALALDVGFTLFYAGYAYVFSLVFDLVRPLASQASSPII